MFQSRIEPTIPVFCQLMKTAGALEIAATLTGLQYATQRWTFKFESILFYPRWVLFRKKKVWSRLYVSMVTETKLSLINATNSLSKKIQNYYFFVVYLDGLGSLACSHSELILKL
jgi:hypothetical protein